MNSINSEKKPVLDTSQLFRMPWTNSDNAFSWLEITRSCNLNCDYCYQKNTPKSEKTLTRVHPIIGKFEGFICYTNGSKRFIQ